MTANKKRSHRFRFLQFTLKQFLVLLTLVTVLVVIVSWHPPRGLQRWNQQRINQRLATAVGAGNLKAASEAIAAGADEYALAQTLNIAVDQNNVPAAMLLLEHGASLSLSRLLPYSPRSSLGNPVRRCIDSGHVEMLELLLGKGAKPTHHDLLAAMEGTQPARTKSRIVNLLLSHGADVDDALEIACLRRDVSLAEKLRQYGATFSPRVLAELGQLDELSRIVAEEPAILNERFAGVQPGGLLGETTLLSIALERGDRTMAHFLLEAGAPVDVMVYGGATLLHSAVLGGDPELVEALLKRGLDLDKNNGDCTPLALAIRVDHTAAAVRLIAAGADVNARSRVAKTTPLIEAVMRHNRRAVEMLLAAGADASLVCPAGRTAYDYARDSKDEAILKLLEQTN